MVERASHLYYCAAEEDLTAAYGIFAQEAQAHQPDYQPQMVNLDGWEPTQTAWKRLWEWGNAATDVPQVIVEKVPKLKANAANFKLTFEYPNAYRTSNTVDRLMNYQDRMLYAMQYFHGSKTAVQQALRAMAMLWNFHPYCRKIQAQSPHSKSPFVG
ncbi:MAG: hypothetical protein ACKO1G_14745 [Microcystis aeruginosa]